jgi:hypothetical protein
MAACGRDAGAILHWSDRPHHRVDTRTLPSAHDGAYGGKPKPPGYATPRRLCCFGLGSPVVCGCENAGPPLRTSRQVATPLSQEITHMARNRGCRGVGATSRECCCPAESANSFHCVMFHRALFEGTAAGGSTSAEAQAKAGLGAFRRPAAHSSIRLACNAVPAYAARATMPRGPWAWWPFHGPDPKPYASYVRAYGDILRNRVISGRF